MKKGWRIILGIVLVALVMGGLCFGVGLLTAQDFLLPAVTHAHLSLHCDETRV